MRAIHCIHLYPSPPPLSHPSWYPNPTAHTHTHTQHMTTSTINYYLNTQRYLLYISPFPSSFFSTPPDGRFYCTRKGCGCHFMPVFVIYSLHVFVANAHNYYTEGGWKMFFFFHIMGWLFWMCLVQTSNEISHFLLNNGKYVAGGLRLCLRERNGF